MRAIPVFAGLACGLMAILGAAPAAAASFIFNTGTPDGQLAAASRPDSSGKIEIETGDDFLLSHDTRLTSATFTGLLAGADVGSIAGVNVEIYRVFPKDSADPPSGAVPTRVNSPSDVAFDSRSSSDSSLSFGTTLLSASFATVNSVLNGINPSPGEFTGGEGSVRGTEVQFDVTFNSAFLLPGDHYFFVPQVQLTSGEFYWLSAPKPIVSGTPFAPDLQAWIRNADLDPNWLRIGTDITHQGPFNMAFSLAGATVPEPGAWTLMIAGFGLAGLTLRRRRAAIA